MVYFTLRWAARFAALLVAGMFLYLLLGELLNPFAGPGPTGFREWAGMGLLLASFAGMLLAWKWELPGALLSLFALALFVLVVSMQRYDVVFVMAIPGLLFVTDSVLRRSHHPHIDLKV